MSAKYCGGTSRNFSKEMTFWLIQNSPVCGPSICATGLDGVAVARFLDAVHFFSSRFQRYLEERIKAETLCDSLSFDNFVYLTER